jgi:hypothetical protein
MNSITNNSAGSSSGTKLRVDCADRISRDKSTRNWLTNLSYLQTTSITKADMPHTKLLEAILDRKRDVVAKVTDHTEDTLKNEWTVYQKLHTNKVKGFLDYICYFECADSFRDIDPPSRQQICDGEGTDVRVLIMDYVKNKSLGEFDWHARDSMLSVFRSCCKQVVCTMVDAHEKLGYRHGDLHSKNVLLKKTTSKNIAYECGQTVETHGFKTVLMDLELSRFDQPSAKFWLDLDEFFSSIVLKACIARHKTVSPIRRLIMNCCDANAPCSTAIELLPMIDDIEFE